MFMFRSKRNIWTKRLLDARKRPSDETRRSVKELLKKLQDKQLEMLLTAIERHERELSFNCILLPREYDPHVLCCQLWRWPDLRQSNELRRLPMCRSVCDPVYICCNPYHWSRLCRTDSPPPPYSRCAMDRLKPEDRAPSEAPMVCRDHYPESLTTNGESSTLNSQAWCTLAYWELSKRVGPLYPVVDLSFVHIFGDVPYGDGLCLETLAHHNFSPPDSVCRTRNKIGLGITVSREDDCIWVYNHSEHPIFVHSVTLEEAESPAPVKVPAGHCLCVYDWAKAACQDYGWNFTQRYGPLDRNSVRISFVKGWGPRYARQEIMSCQCWLEILLAPCR